MPVFERRVLLPASPPDVFAWHARPGAFERLTPPWERVRILERVGDIREGLVTLEVRVGPVRTTWVAQHGEHIPNRQFVDTQIRGPFRKWVHTHQFEPEGKDGCALTDHIEYAPPLGVPAGAIEPKLERAFAYRHRVTKADLETHARWKHIARKRIAISGASGLIGSSLAPMLTTGGHEVLRLARHRPLQPGEAPWEPAEVMRPWEEVEGVDAVVHLAGANIGEGRWTPARKALFRESRVDATRHLCRSLAALRRKPSVLVCASATGFYGNRGDETVSEDSPSGTGFLAELVRDWEAATQPAAEAGIRVVLMRFGIVLTPRGGALAKLLTPFRFGAGGPIGSGRQWWSWISIDDAIGAIYHALMADDMEGPVNAVSPEPATQRDFASTLGRVLNRPSLLPTPAFALRAALGEMADEMLLSGARVRPDRLKSSGYRFAYPTLEAALRHVLGRANLSA